MTRPSAQASSNMRMAVTALMTLSTVFQLIALVSNHWISGNGRQEILYLGIWKGCSIYECGDQTGAGYVKASLVVSFIVSVILSGIFLLHYWVDFSDVSNFKICMGKMVLAMTFFQASGMVYASIFFILSLYYGGLRYAYFLGWIGVIVSVAAGVLSYYHGKIEPEVQATPNTVQDMTGATPENPPPYSVMP